MAQRRKLNAYANGHNKGQLIAKIKGARDHFEQNVTIIMEIFDNISRRSPKLVPAREM